jgi:DNA anti-recombination protein RmuC
MENCAAELEQAEMLSGQSVDEIGTFLGAMAKVLHETIARFEETVGRITDIAVLRSGRADRDLVVALQEFDRLQQEFVTLGEVLSRVATTSNGVWSAEAGAVQLGHEAIAAISIAELKERLVRHLNGSAADLPMSETSDEVVF